MRILDKAKITNVRIYGSVQNLYTFTKYKGYDPEIGAFDNKILLMNVDMGHYPNPRIVTIGGGHGLSTLLRGLKTYTRNLTAIVTVADDGSDAARGFQCPGAVVTGQRVVGNDHVSRLALERGNEALLTVRVDQVASNATAPEHDPDQFLVEHVVLEMNDSDRARWSGR